MREAGRPDSARDAARAAFALACGLLALAWPRGDRSFEACSRPQLRAPGEVVCVAFGTSQSRLAGPARRLFGLRIDPNFADATTLTTLPGIGPARARAILAERCRRPFATLSDLRRVRGLGPVRVAALAPHVGFEPRLATLEPASVESGTCRSCCGSAGPPHPTPRPDPEEP